MIQLHLPPEIEARLAAEARAQGLTPQDYVEKLVTARFPPPHAQAGLADRMAALEKFFEEMAAHSEKIPPLPDEAFTRESFYQDHD